MENRIFDLLLGLFVGQCVPATIVAFGLTVHWASVGLCIILSWMLLKQLLRWSLKLGVFLWKKLITTVKAEVLKELSKK